ncbi:Low-affinity potassium transport [Fusarium albosuccineum]|uniref:Low-affinity potassium transport n=1 Tax=Fusarium albosuccineum TaxID=1237068 RepID=A0A8H4KJX4_9HYPO|nr:Low-affinity potassium transport [Fusarium albosuccineum]
MSLLALPVLAPYGNLSAIDAYFFGCSAATESGLNTVDLKELKIYQQLYLYFIPVITNLCFINIAVVVVRLYWFRRHLKRLAPQLLTSRRRDDPDAHVEEGQDKQDETSNDAPAVAPDNEEKDNLDPPNPPVARATTITFDPSVEPPKDNTTLYIPRPQDRDRGHPIVANPYPKSLRNANSSQESHITPVSRAATEPGPSVRRRRPLRINSGDGIQMTAARSMDRVAGVATSLLVLGSETMPPRRLSTSSITRKQLALNDRPFLSRQATIGRNSQFHNLTSEDRELLGGIEYRSLKLLLKIVLDPDVDWAARAIYSAQTMVDNLGFTLTPDSMISFRDAKFPMLLMSLLAFAGNTLYPVFLRLTIWTMHKIVPKRSQMREPLAFLLNHPRRCYTLLFPSMPTWILFAIIFSLNFVDVLLIIVLDLDNPEVASLRLSARIPAAIFQAASARHTGTATFNLANVNPAVQLSLLIMMYIAVFPIALSIRSSNTYEERSLGIWEEETHSLSEESGGKSYLVTHMKNQLGFDLWYIFLGTFCISIAESERIADIKDPAFTVFSILFEVTSAYGNVGLSLGYPTVATSLSGKFKTFSKVVICLMMIRGRHRGLPYALDRAIMLPNGQLVEGPSGTTH